MKRIAAILCFFAIAWNTALASVSGIVYCIDKSLDEQPDTAVQASYVDCMDVCPFESRTTSSPLPFECELCIDFEIDADELKNSNLSGERIAIKAPLAIEWIPLAILSISQEEFTYTSLPPRAPALERSASREYASTIQFRI